MGKAILVAKGSNVVLPFVRSTSGLYFLILLPSAFAEGNEVGTKYFDAPKMHEQILETTTAICGEIGFGFTGYDFKLGCKASVCEGSLAFSGSSYKSQVYLSPGYDLLFSRRLEKASDQEIKKISLHLDNSDIVPTISVTSSEEDLNINEAEDLSSCLSKLNSELKNSIPEEKFKELIESTDNITSESHTFIEAFNSQVHIYKPRSVFAGEAFVLSAIVIPSLEFKRNFSDEISIQEAIGQVKRALEEKVESDGSDTLVDLSMNISVYSGISFESTGSAFQKANLSLVGSDSNIIPISTGVKRMVGLSPSEWHWLVKVDRAADFVMSIELSTNPPLRRSLHFTVKPEFSILTQIWLFVVNNFRWFLASLFIPILLIFVKSHLELRKPSTD